MPIIKQGNSLGKFYDQYKKGDLVLVKSLVSFYGQVNKALRSISHWLVSLLALIYFGWRIVYRSFLNYLKAFSPIVKT